MNPDALKALIASLGPVPDQEIDQLLAAGCPKVIKKGELLLHPGQVCQQLYFLEQGFMRMYHCDPAGNEINYQFAQAPTYVVDFQSFLTQTPSRYYWQALKDSQLMAFSYNLVQAYYHQSPLWNNLGRIMAERAYLVLNERVELLQFLSPQQRYEFVLKTYPQLPKTISQAHLASYLGIKPESLSRIRQRLTKKRRS